MAFLALLAYLFFVFIRPQDFWLPLFGVPVVRFSLLVILVFLLADKAKRFDAPLNRFMLLMTIWIFLAGLLNGGFGEAQESLVKFLTGIMLPFYVVQNMIKTEKQQRIVMAALIGFALIMVNDGMAQKASPIGVGWSGASLSQGTRITYVGIFSDPNDLGMFLVMTVPFAIYFFYRAGFFLKCMWLVSLGYILYGIYLTNSRGALLGVMALAGFWFYRTFGIVKSAAVGVFAAPVALFVMGKFRAIDAEEESAAGRLDAWYEGIQLLLWKPFFGVGMGNFTDYHYLTAHNSFVLVFSELGMPGYFFWVAMLAFAGIILLTHCLPDLKGSRVEHVAEGERTLALTLTYSMIGYLVTCFFLSRAYTPLLYIFLAMIVGLYYRSSADWKSELRVSFREYSGFVFKFVFGSLLSIYVMVKLFV